MKIAVVGNDSGSFFMARKLQSEGHDVTLFRLMNVESDKVKIFDIKKINKSTFDDFERAISLTHDISSNEFFKTIFEKFGNKGDWISDDKRIIEKLRPIHKLDFKNLGIPSPEYKKDYPGKCVVKYNLKWFGGLQTEVFEDIKDFKPIEGETFTVEQFIEIKKELSVHVYAKGGEFQLLQAARDYKKRYEGDVGHNTFSMGCYTVKEVPPIVVEHIAKFVRHYNWYEGVMYFGVAFDQQDDVWFLEFNSRYGNPEIISVLSPENKYTVCLRVFKNEPYTIENVGKREVYNIDILENDKVSCAPDVGVGLKYFTLYSTADSVDEASKNIYDLVNKNQKFFKDRNLTYRTDIGILK